MNVPDTGRTTQLRTYLTLRLTVGLLGEKANHGWWQTSFLSSTAKAFLEPAFPKTWRLAQVHGVLEAARLVHDEHIGVGRVFHLFRLPEETEQDLHELTARLAVDDEIFGVIKSNETAAEALEKFAGVATWEAEGPVLVAKISEFGDETTIARIAAYYRSAFEKDVRSYPYLGTDG